MIEQGKQTVAERTPRLLLIGDASAPVKAVARILSRAGLVEILTLIDGAQPKRRPTHLVVDIDLASADSVARLKDAIRRARLQDVGKIFFVDGEHMQAATQARALGASTLILRPFRPQTLLAVLRADLAGDFLDRLDSQPNDVIGLGVRAAHGVLETIFEGLPSGQTLRGDALDPASDALVGALEDGGLTAWIETVKTHHSHSYRHSLLVTGVATGFAQFVGANRHDRLRVARAALVHDVGKAFVPLSILDKPDRLTEAEMAQMSLHPQLGADVLARASGITPETLDAVLHHHEMLDGSGYPDKLSGSEIPDLTRIITISDIFSALIEERAYKTAFTSERALEILFEMSSKLDRSLLRAFAAMIERQGAGSYMTLVQKSA